MWFWHEHWHLGKGSLKHFGSRGREKQRREKKKEINLHLVFSSHVL